MKKENFEQMNNIITRDMGLVNSEMEIPKIFWRYYDLYRRNQITMNQYVEKTGIAQGCLTQFLEQIKQEAKIERNNDIF